MENRTDLSYEDLANLTEEIWEVLNETASFSFVNEFVRNSIVPYSEKWHRRTLKMVDDMRGLRNVMSSAWNFTRSMVNTFNETLVASMAKMSRKVDSLADLLDEDFDADQEKRVFVIRLDVQPFDIKELFLYITILELFLVLIALLMMQHAKVRSKLIEQRNQHRKIHHHC
jgi:hypothetical protein